jgi:hypothetical protein
MCPTKKEAISMREYVGQFSHMLAIHKDAIAWSAGTQLQRRSMDAHARNQTMSISHAKSIQNYAVLV